MFWSLLFGSDNYEPTEREKEFDRLLDRCEQLKKQIEAKRELGISVLPEMIEWKSALKKLNNENIRTN